MRAYALIREDRASDLLTSTAVLPLASVSPRVFSIYGGTVSHSRTMEPLRRRQVHSLVNLDVAVELVDVASPAAPSCDVVGCSSSLSVQLGNEGC